MTTRKPTTKRKPAKRKARKPNKIVAGLDEAIAHARARNVTVQFTRYKHPDDRVPWWRKVWVAVFGA